MPNLGAVRRERFLTIYNPLNPPGVRWVKILIFFKVRVSIRTCVPNLGAIRRERFLTIYNPLNPPGVGWVKFCYFFKGRVSIRTCVRNLDAIRRERFLTIYNPLNPPPGGVGQFFLRWEYLSAHASQIWARSDGRVPKSVSETYTAATHTTTPRGGVGQFFVCFTIRTCVPNLGAVRSHGAVRRSSI